MSFTSPPSRLPRNGNATEEEVSQPSSHPIPFIPPSPSDLGSSQSSFNGHSSSASQSSQSSTPNPLVTSASSLKRKAHAQSTKTKPPTSKRVPNPAAKKYRPARYSDEEDELESEEEDDEYDDQSEEEEDRKTRKKKSASSYSSATAASSKSAVIKPSNAIKIVSFDSVHIPMGDKSIIEKLISWRKVDADGNRADEFLVKYKSMSYMHAEWVPRSVVEAERMGKNRIARFLSKPLYESQWSEDEPFNPSFLKIDRIIDDGEAASGQIFYLVKWCAQTYDLSTWELEDAVISLDEDKIDEFHQRKIISPRKLASYRDRHLRPNISKWTTLPASPVYKNENTLRTYQLEGLNWLSFCWYKRQHCILADEMGLGKTVQSTVFLEYISRVENVQGPFLVVTPLSTIGNWEREIRAWTDFNVIVYHGSGASRNLIVETEFYHRDENGSIIPSVYKFDIILTTYEMAMSGINHLRPIDWRVVILDEAHRLKSKSSKVAELLKQYKMEHRVLLTGTPLQNSLDELWALLNFLDPIKFESEESFQEAFGSLKSAQDVEKLQLLLKPLMLRRLKEDVETSIPVKEETIIEVELTNLQKKWYRGILEKNFGWLKQGLSGPGARTNTPNLINIMMELRKCCIHPFLLNGAEDQIYQDYGATTTEQQFAALIQASGKMVLLDKLLRKLHAGGHKVLIFSQMTRCLDIIQDYLRYFSWPFERIDGGVRGDLRQAAIDRFSDPANASSSFVFLLCTRAGGVGINLTAADTVIIYDSDWNPQNDLQAQSRCHRIGQKKEVQIYRLITRNTYEREMFDRASMKLGLDKAILQRMDSSSGSDAFNPSSAAAALSKEDVEDLLKKGAYGAFMEDDASKEFCEEDIDQILTRRTQVIRHDGTSSGGQKGSIFSKASFASTNAAADVDINDPNFWDKVAAKAQLEVVEMPIVDPTASLILSIPRERKVVSYQESSTSGAPGATGPAVPPTSDRFRFVNVKDAKIWTITERMRLERSIMVHGFGRFDTMDQKRRSASDFQAAARALVHFCLLHVKDLTPVTLENIEAAMAIYPRCVPDGTLLDPEEEDRPEIDPDSNTFITPYPGANPRQIMEYRSFLITASDTYRDVLKKKGKNMLLRISMLYEIRNKIKPTPDLIIPEIPGLPLTPWWGKDEDRDLLLGICKHGYQMYDSIRDDPEFCFSKRRYANVPYHAVPLADSLLVGGTSVVSDDGVQSMKVDESKDGPTSVELHPSNAQKEKQPKAVSPEEDEDEEGMADLEGGMDDQDEAEKELDVDSVDELEEDEEIIPASAASQPVVDFIAPVQAQTQGEFYWPVVSEIGLRVRRVMTQLLKIVRHQEGAIPRRRKNAVGGFLTQMDAHASLSSSPLSKKDRMEFQRGILMYGVDYSSPDQRDWSGFKRVYGFNKTDEVMEAYYLKFLSICHECLQLHEAGITTPPPNSMLAQMLADGEVMHHERAKRVFRRLENFRDLRERILADPNILQRMSSIRRHRKTLLPKWWNYTYDYAYLKGIGRYGLSMTSHDAMLEDPEIGFSSMYAEWKASMIKRTELRLGANELVDDRFGELFWPMKDGFGTRRFEALLEILVKTPGSSSASVVPALAGAKRASRKSNVLAALSGPEFSLKSLSVALFNKGRRVKGIVKPDSPALASVDDEGLSGEDTDAMVELARVKVRKYRKKLTGTDTKADHAKEEDGWSSDDAVLALNAQEVDHVLQAIARRAQSTTRQHVTAAVAEEERALSATTAAAMGVGGIRRLSGA